MKSRHEVAWERAQQYKGVLKSKKKKTEILNKFIDTTRYNRKYAIRLLRALAIGTVIYDKGKLIKVKAENPKKREKRKRVRYYDEKVKAALKIIWTYYDMICGKNLAPVMKEAVEILDRDGALKGVSPLVKKKLSQLSAATIDRLLRDEKNKFRVKGIPHPRSSSALKYKIPIKTFSEWKGVKPGHIHADTVGHDGGITRGDFCWSLDMTDVATGWTEPAPLLNRAQKWTVEEINKARERFPFPIVALHSDGGSEFINAHLKRYCAEENLEFSKGRRAHKNDNPYVEQKNYSVIRRAVGYARYEGEEDVKLLGKIYEVLRLHSNFFKPQRKLVRKEQIGSKVKKFFDESKSPYRRVLESPDVSQEEKDKLTQIYKGLSLVKIKKELDQRINKLWRQAAKRPGNLLYFPGAIKKRNGKKRRKAG